MGVIVIECKKGRSQIWERQEGPNPHLQILLGKTQAAFAFQQKKGGESRGLSILLRREN